MRGCHSAPSIAGCFQWSPEKTNTKLHKTKFNRCGTDILRDILLFRYLCESMSRKIYCYVVAKADRSDKQREAYLHPNVTLICIVPKGVAIYWWL